MEIVDFNLIYVGWVVMFDVIVVLVDYLVYYISLTINVGMNFNLMYSTAILYISILPKVPRKCLYLYNQGAQSIYRLNITLFFFFWFIVFYI